MSYIKRIFIFVFAIGFTLANCLCIPKVEAKTINDLKKDLNKALQNQDKTNNDIKQTEGQINQTKENISQIYTDIDNINIEIATKTNEISKLNNDIVTKDKETKELMRSLQVTSGDSMYLEYIMGAESLTDFIYRIAITEQLTKYNNDLINSMNNTIKENEQKKIELADEQVRLAGKQKDLKVKLESLGKAREGLYEFQESLSDEIKAASQVISMYEKAGCKPDEDLNVCANRLLPPDTRFWRPLTSGYKTSLYGMRKNPYDGVYKMHEGVDLSNADKTNTKVYAVANGKVAYVGYANDGLADSLGNYIVIHHNINGTNYTTMYLHLKTGSIVVQIGQMVTKDTILATMGSTGDSTGPHLHLSVAEGLFYTSTNYYVYSSFAARTVDPESVVNFPNGLYVSWADRTHMYDNPKYGGKK